MKIFSIVFIVLAIALSIYNFALVDFSHPFQGDSIVALIGVLASFCSILLLVILNLSKKVEQKIKDRTDV